MIVTPITLPLLFSFTTILDLTLTLLQINQSIGPSGENREYLLQLDSALLQLSPHSRDEHISDLARRVRAMQPASRSPKERRMSEAGLQKVSSTEEQEEIEKDC